MCKSLKTFEGDRLFPVNKSVNNVHNTSGKLSGYPHEPENEKEPPGYPQVINIQFTCNCG